MEEFDYIMSISERLEAGKWVVAVGRRIVAQGDDPKKVFDRARERYPGRELFIMKVPDNANMLL
jgi:orotidine-5'-phosphate decarboxylase